MSHVFLVSICLTSLALFTAGMVTAADRMETVRCYELQKQANDFENFYLTASEARMCAHLGILINAPVK